MGAVMRIPVRISVRVEDGIPLFLAAGTGRACGVHESEQDQSVNPAVKLLQQPSRGAQGSILMMTSVTEGTAVLLACVMGYHFDLGFVELEGRATGLVRTGA